MRSPQKHKLDIFKVLDHISRYNVEFYDELTVEEQKSIQPLVLMRWLSGTKNTRQVFFLNELVNPLVFSFSQHKKLLLQLMTICTTGKPTKYKWIKQKSKSTTTPTAIDVIKQFYGYNTRDAREALPLLTTDQLIEHAEHLGRQPPDIKAIKKELKNRV